MTIEELRQKPHLSATGIGDYLSCSLLYKLGRIDKLPPDFTPDALEFGTVIHRALGDYYNAKKAGGKMALKELLDTFAHYWEDAAYGRENIRYKEGDSYYTLLTKGKELLKSYYESLPDDKYTVLAVEEPFSFMIKGVDVPVIGAIDLIETDGDTIILTDFKTAGKSYTSEEIDNSFQLSVYNMAMRANGFEHKEILLRFDLLIKTKVSKFEQQYTVRDESHLLKAANTIRLAWQGIRQGVFIPNAELWKCKGCSYKSHCENELRR